MGSSEDQGLEEVLKRISSPPLNETPTYHPSECVNRVLDPHCHESEPCKSNRKILDVINSYHVYCKVCQHHYYSCSKSNDINSFFQIHINSIDHIWNRGSCDWDKTKPIFQWEKWLCTGFCALCNKSGIEAFVVDSQFDIVNIIRQHLRSNGHQQKYRSINNERFDEIMAKLDLFSKIYIIQVSKGRYLCKVCGLKIKGEASLDYHLNSQQHCQKFCQFFKKKLNGNIENHYIISDAEKLAQQMEEILNSERSSKKKVIYCYETDSRESELRFLSEPELGFSPSAIERAYSVVDADLQQVRHCSLCQVYPQNMDRHLLSNTHQLRVMVYKQCSSVRPVSLIEFLHGSDSSPIKLKKEVQKYRKCKQLLQKQGLDFGIPFKPEYVGVSLNSESRSNEASYESVCNIIKCIERGNLLEKASYNVEKSNKTRDCALPIENENFRYDRKTDKNNAVNEKLEITKEKISDVVFSIVQSCIDKYLDNVLSARDKYEPCDLLDTLDEGSEDYYYYEDRATMIQRHRSDPQFIHTIETWNYLDTSYFVCVLCGFSGRSPEYLFRHMKKKVHVKRFEQLKSGKLKRLSPLGYLINVAKESYLCKKCGKRIHSITLPQNFSIPLAARSIKKHESECPVAKACTPALDADSLTAELKRVLMIGKESHGTESAGRKNGVRVNPVEMQESTSKPDAKKVKKSPPGPRENTMKQMESCVGKADKKKVKESEPVRPDKTNPRPRDGKTQKGKTKEEAVMPKREPDKGKKRNSAKGQQPQNGNVLKQNLGNFLKHCGSGLTDFLCVICLVNDDMNAIGEHLKSETHMANEAYIRGKWVVQLGLCKFCKLLLLGTCDMFRQHYASAYHAIKERAASGKETLQESLTPRIIKLLIVRGMPMMGKEDEEKCIRLLLEPFGAIKKVYVKRKWSEVEFFDHRVIEDILTLGKFMISDTQYLSFTLKQVTREVEIGMKSTEIFLLGHDKAMSFVSDLVQKANEMMLSAEEKEKEEKLCDMLQKVIGCIYPKCKCFKFGSRVTGLIVGDCDLDVFLDYGNKYYGECEENPQNQCKIVKKVAVALKASRQFSDVTGIEHCRVPIVTCLHKSTNIHCDISFKNGLSCENTNLIKFMISLDDRVKGVILFLKYWTKRNGLHGRPYFSSYALTMLVFFYLQQEPNPVLPTVEFLKSCYTEPEKVIGEWDCGFTTDRERIPKTKNSDSVMELILGFFNFCNSFNFSENIISPLTGKNLPKEIIKNMAKDGLPDPYKKYQSKISPGNYEARESICVMDPFDLNHNLTKVFPQYSFKRFLYLCRLSVNLLSNSLQSKYFVHLHENSLY